MAPPLGCWLIFLLFTASDEILPLIKLSRPGCSSDAWFSPGWGWSRHASDRPLRRDCRLHFPSPELWSPAANVRAGQAGTESIKRRGRRSESSVVAGALTWGHRRGLGTARALGSVNCHQIMSPEQEPAASVYPTSIFCKVGILSYLHFASRVICQSRVCV